MIAIEEVKTLIPEFQLPDRSWVDSLKVGDRVRVRYRRQGLTALVESGPAFHTIQSIGEPLIAGFAVQQTRYITAVSDDEWMREVAINSEGFWLVREEPKTLWVQWIEPYTEPVQSRYSLIIQWCEVDRRYLVSIPEFAGLVPAPCTEGATYEEAAKNGKDVIDTFLELWAGQGKDFPRPQIYPPKALHPEFDSATYRRMLASVLPQRITTQEEYDRIAAVFEPLHAVRGGRSREELALYWLLAVLMQDYGTPED